MRGNESPSAAARFLDHCLSDFQRLAQTPLIGRFRQFANPRAQNVRSWIIAGFPKHMIFYQPIDDGVEILHVLHGARNIEAIFDDPDADTRHRP